MSEAFIPYPEKFPLLNNPVAGINYSNPTSNLLGIILARSCGVDLKSFAQEHLFTPPGIDAWVWEADPDGYYIGCSNLHLAARDLAKFGLLYMNEGVYNGKRIISAAWVKESLENYSADAWITKHRERKSGLYFRNLVYRYQWWSASVGNRRIDFAWGHGGQLVVLLHELNMIIVATADPQRMRNDDESWKQEQDVFNLVGRYIFSLSHPRYLPPKKEIHVAALDGDEEAIRQHILAGSDPDEKEAYGNTALIIATTFGRIIVAADLINADADMDIKNSDGSTARIAAAFFCSKEIVKQLLDKGADSNIKNNTGSTTIDLVSLPFEKLKPIYELVEKTLKPLGLELDLEYIKITRPIIREMLVHRRSDICTDKRTNHDNIKFSKSE